MTDSEIAEAIRIADAKWNVADLTEAMLVILRRKPTMTFADFESHLRNLNSETYLVARPRGYRPTLGNLDVRFLNGKRAEYYLYVCLHGEEERNNQLAVWKGTATTNFIALGKCGVFGGERTATERETLMDLLWWIFGIAGLGAVAYILYGHFKQTSAAPKKPAPKDPEAPPF